MLLLDKQSWEIRETHKSGRGVFATKSISPGTVISDYLGTVLRTAIDDTSEKDGLYLMYYHDYASIYPEDIREPGAHLINHSCMPNCWVYTYHGHTLFFTLRTIFPGEELTISYLLPPQEHCKQCRHQCFCEQSNCNGTMHLSKERFTSWQIVSEAQAKATKRKRIQYHKSLKPLNEYPRTLPDHPIYDLFGSLSVAPITVARKQVPTIPQIRSLIRKTGRMVKLSTQKQIILGIQDDTIIYR